MKLKALVFIAASLSTVAIAAGALRGASQQMWNPQMAQAAKVTVKLLHGKGFSPMLFARSNRALIKSNQPFAVPFSHSDELLNYTLNGRHSFSDYSQTNYSQANYSQVKATHSLDATKGKTESAMDQQIILLNSQVTTSKQSARFQNWVGGVEGTLKQQNYQLKKLEFELAKQKYQKGEISSTVLMKKTQEYQIASQEFKAFINSLKMAD